MFENVPVCFHSDVCSGPVWVHLSGRATRSLGQSDLIVTSHVTKNSSDFGPAHWVRSNFVPLSRAGSG